MFIDSHAHIDYPDFEGDLDEVLFKAKVNGVDRIINAGTTVGSSKRAVALSKKFKGIVYATAGLHPHDIEEAISISDQLKEIEKLIKKEKNIVSLGECGLDYSRIFKEDTKDEDEYEIKKQKELFISQLMLAEKYKLPVIIHSRLAEEDTLDILSKAKHKNLKGVVHCHTGTIDFARKVMDLGFYIGFTGIITFPNAGELLDVIKEIPMDRILIETDAPFLAPVPYRGMRNEPAYVVEVAKKVAEIKNISLDEVAKATSKNVEKLFGI